MGIFDRFRKKTEEPMSEERSKQIVTKAFKAIKGNPEDTKSYLNELDENELKDIYDFLKSWRGSTDYSVDDKIHIAKDIAKEVLKNKKKSKVPFSSFLKDKTGTLPRREKEEAPESKEKTEKTGLFGFLRGKPKTEEQIASEMERKTQNIAKDLYFKVSDFWGISKGEIKGKLPKVKFFSEDEYKKAIDSGFIMREQEGKIYIDEEKNLIIAPLNFFKEEEKSVGFDGFKAFLAEEVSHKIDGIVMQRPTIHSEFFAMVSRILFAEIAPGSFKKEYGNYMRIAAAFRYSLKSLLDKEKYLKDSFSKAKSIEELNASMDKLVEVQRLLNHILQLPALSSCFYIQKMSKEDRHNLLDMDPEKLHKDVVYDIGVKGIEEIRKKMEKRLEYSKDRNYREVYEKFVKFLAENPNPEEKIKLTKEEIDTSENRKKIFKDMKKEMIRYSTKELENVGTFYEKAEKGGITENKEAIAAAEAINYKQEEREFEEGKQLEKQVQSLLKPSVLEYKVREAEKIKKFSEKIPEEKTIESESRLTVETVEKQINAEMQTEENEILTCPHCGEEFTGKDNLSYAEHLKNHEFSKGPIAATPDFIKEQKAIIEDFIKKSDEYMDKLPESPQISVLSKMLMTVGGKIGKEKETTLRKQIDLQDLTDRISLKLAGFWGISKDKIFTPFIKILSAEEAKKLGVPILKMFPKEPIGSDILINSEYLSNEFQGRMDIKSVLAEEVCHSMEDFIKAYGYKEDKYVAEFFGLISRLYIAEQSPELFKDEYKKFLHSKSAIFFSEEKKQVDSLLAQCEQDKKMLRHLQIEGRQPANLVEIKIGKIEDAERKLNDYRDHLAYYPAAAYYFEIKRMDPDEREKLYEMSNDEIRKNVIEGKAEKILLEIGEKIQEREERLVEESVKADLKIPQEAETAQFFERTEKDNVGAEIGAIVAGAAIANELKQEEKKLVEGIKKDEQDIRPYDESIKDHVKERVYGIPAGQQSNKTNPVQIKVSERSDIEQAALGAGAIASAEATELGKEAFEKELKLEEEEKIIEQEEKEFEEIEQEEKEFEEIVEKQKELEGKKSAGNS